MSVIDKCSCQIFINLNFREGFSRILLFIIYFFIVNYGED